jgi:hypothetical protein
MKSKAPSINLFALGETNEDLKNELPTFFAQWQEEIDAAEPVFDIEGERLEKLARDIPHHQFFYAKRAQEARAVVKWLEIEKARKESRHVKNYNNSPRALGVKEQSLYIQGEKDVVELNQLIVEANLKQQHFDEIVEAIKQMGWMCSNMVKLRVAEMHDAII